MEIIFCLADLSYQIDVSIAVQSHPVREPQCLSAFTKATYQALQKLI